MFEPYRHSYGIFLMTFSDCKVTRPHWLFRHAPITSIIRDLCVYYKWLLKSLLKHNRFPRKPLLDNRKPFNATSQSESMLEIEIGRSTWILKFGILSNLTKNESLHRPGVPGFCLTGSTTTIQPKARFENITYRNIPIKHDICCSRSQWQPRQPVLLVWVCINYHVSVTHYKRPYDTQMARNKSVFGSVLAPDNTVYNIHLWPIYSIFVTALCPQMTW